MSKKSDKDIAKAVNTQHIQIKDEAIKPYHYAGIFLVSMSVLVLEFNLTRVFSVSLWYNFAFMVISVALLGTGISGVALNLFERLLRIPTDLFLSLSSALYGISVIVSFILMNLIPLDPFSLLSQSEQMIYLPLYYLLITIPFFFAGCVISLLLTKFKSHTNILYFFDLTGAGLGSVIFIVCIPYLGGNGTMVIIAMMGLLASIIFGMSRYKWISIASLVLLIFSVTYIIERDEKLPISISPNKQFISSLSDNPDAELLTRWNTFSKVDVVIDEEDPIDDYPLYIGIIDGGNASTNIPNVKVMPPVSEPFDASNLAFITKDSAANAFIIGSAGGGEILTSFYHNIKNVTAVEINGILNDFISEDLSYWTGPLIKGNKNLKLITDDARSALARQDGQFDVILSAHTISASAMASGAMSMVENFILTQQAVNEYIDKLTPSGVLYISRPETQLPKLITTLRKSDPTGNFKNKISVFRRVPHEGTYENEKSYLAGILYKKDGYTPSDLLNIRNQADKFRMEILYDAISEKDSYYKFLAETPDLESAIANAPTDIHPATDNKPFFDNNIGFTRLNLTNMQEVFRQNERAITALKDKPVAETTLLVLLIQVIIIAGILLLVPFFITRKRKGDKPDKKFYVYFSLLGAGYIMLQIAMMQKFTLFIGQPVYTMLTVISTMLVSSGLGSILSFKIFKDKKFVYIFGMIVVLSLFIGIVAPYIFYALYGSSLFIRLLISVILIFPLGFMLGMPFPLGIASIPDKARGKIPLCWALNGFFSVISTTLTMIIAMMAGYMIIFILSAIIYLAAFLVLKNNFSIKLIHT